MGGIKVTAKTLIFDKIAVVFSEWKLLLFSWNITDK